MHPVKRPKDNQLPVKQAIIVLRQKGYFAVGPDAPKHLAGTRIKAAKITKSAAGENHPIAVAGHIGMLDALNCIGHDKPVANDAVGVRQSFVRPFRERGSE